MARRARKLIGPTIGGHLDFGDDEAIFDHGLKKPSGNEDGENPLRIWLKRHRRS
jgi:hypothetical protein